MSGAYTPTPEQLNAVPLPVGVAINALVGSAATLLTRPEGKKILVVKAAKGNFTMRVGNVTGAMPAAAVPAASLTNGTAGWHIGEGQVIVFPAHVTQTVKGYNSDDALLYYWL